MCHSIYTVCTHTHRHTHTRTHTHTWTRGMYIYLCTVQCDVHTYPVHTCVNMSRLALCWNVHCIPERHSTVLDGVCGTPSLTHTWSCTQIHSNPPMSAHKLHTHSLLVCEWVCTCLQCVHNNRGAWGAVVCRDCSIGLETPVCVNWGLILCIEWSHLLSLVVCVSWCVHWGALV